MKSEILFCSLTLSLAGYQSYRAPVIVVPVTKLIKRNVSIAAQPKQIVYIGDYDTTLITYICLYQQNRLGIFRNLQIDLKNNLDDRKNSFMSSADDKTKAKLDNFQFISALDGE